MIFQSLVFALFFLFSLFLQILIIKNFTFDDHFLKVGRVISLRLFTIVIFIFTLLSVGLIFLYSRIDILDRLLYLYFFLFLSGIFITLFLILKIKSIFLKLIFSITIATVLVSFTLFYQLPILKNIVTVCSLLWISPLLFKYINIKRIYLLGFMVFFMLFDIYNVFILSPVISKIYNHIFLNGYVEIGSFALGMGDFFLAFFVLGLMWRDRGIIKSYILAIVMSLFLFIIYILAFKQDIPFSVFIVIPTLLIYFLQNKYQVSTT